MKEITLTVSIDEANLILDALGSRPFAEVYKLVSKIQGQANEQLDTDSDDSSDSNKKNP